MGLDQKVTLTTALPPWSALAATMAARGLPLQLRMIDNELAFPDETPPDTWRELRVSTPAGMITLRREADGIRLVIWGNADAALQAACQTLAAGIGEAAQPSSS